MSSPTQFAPRYASLATAAEYLGCNERTVRRYVASGMITAYRFGDRLIRVDLNQVDSAMRPVPNAQPNGKGAGGDHAA
jgi:excisionase family DNA binding protein